MREYKEVCLQLLRNIATLETFEEHTMAVNKLKDFHIGSINMVTTLSSMLLTACQVKEAYAKQYAPFLVLINRYFP